jgi:hypothetical protein
MHSPPLTVKYLADDQLFCVIRFDRSSSYRRHSMSLGLRFFALRVSFIQRMKSMFNRVDRNIYGTKWTHAGAPIDVGEKS